MRTLGLAAAVTLGSIVAGAHSTHAAPKVRPSVPAAIELRVDASDASRGLFHSRLELPARAGAMTLVYPKWIPGEHGPTGPINGMAGLRMSAGGKALAWHRDPVDMYAFHVTVPAGVSRLVIELDFMAPIGQERFTAGASTTKELAMLSWNQLVLYPEGTVARDVPVAPGLRLPADWRFGTALEVANQQGREVRFRPVSLETLVDSPVLMGAHFATVPLTADGRVQIDMACDGEPGLVMPEDLVAAYRRLVAEADALFGARPFAGYHFLLTLSDHTSHFGLEHHSSSDNRVPERSLLDSDLRNRMATLLPHEYVHAWNGKYRRPVGLATRNYQEPMQGEMLWVYEGLTQYLAWILTARSGLRPADAAREQLADVAAYLDQRPGRTWRPLRDTAVGAQLVFQAPDAGAEWRRAADFYNEGLLIWLDVDVAIRQLTNGDRSLDDFCKRFHGGGGDTAGPRVVPFTIDDLVADLNAVAPHDWRAFLDERLDSTAPRAPLGGITGGGWALAWSDSVPGLQRSLEEANENCDVRYSIGFKVTSAGDIVDVVPGKPAALAGVAAGDRLVAVDGRKYTRKVLREAIRDARAGLALLVQRGEFFTTHALDHDGGDRYPVLRRDPAKADILTVITAPQSSPFATRD